MAGRAWPRRRSWTCDHRPAGLGIIKGIDLLGKHIDLLDLETLGNVVFYVV